MNTIRKRPSSINELFIDSGKILRYLIGDDDKLDTLLMCNPHSVKFVTTDQEVYHALGSINESDNFRLNKLTKFFEVVTIRTVARKHLLTDNVVEKLRDIALSEKLR